MTSRKTLLAAAAAALIGGAGTAAMVASSSTTDPQCAKIASKTGSDSSPGTVDQPYKTVGKLVASLASGQTGCLRAGTSVEDVSIATAGITVRRIRASVRHCRADYGSRRAPTVLS
jgi:hypothetical protein